ncbi:hypothetical protein GCM10009583_10680 [Ornithinicoccus hortensis]
MMLSLRSCGAGTAARDGSEALAAVGLDSAAGGDEPAFFRARYALCRHASEHQVRVLPLAVPGKTVGSGRPQPGPGHMGGGLASSQAFSSRSSRARIALSMRRLVFLTKPILRLMRYETLQPVRQCMGSVAGGCRRVEVRVMDVEMQRTLTTAANVKIFRSHGTAVKETPTVVEVAKS